MKKQFSPKFCPKHLKIHICDNTDVSSKLKNMEDELGKKVRRLHGTPNEEDIIKETMKAEKNKPKKGTLDYILSHAKNKITKLKSNLNESSGDYGNETSEDELTSRISNLRNKVINNNSSTPPTSSKNQKKSSYAYSSYDDDIIEDTTTVLGLGGVISNAKKYSSEFNIEYKVPERGTFGEKKPEKKKKGKSK